MAITTNSPSARCLDLTRLISRVGRGPLTGIDRVELEYLTRLLLEDTPLFGLVRVAPGFALLDPLGMQEIADRIAGKSDWGPLDTLARLHPKAPELQRRAHADVRRISCAKGRRITFGKTVKQYLPAGTAYLNVGHSNLNGDMFTAIRCVPNATITIMIHDSIPLDFPDYQREGTVQKFETKLRLVGQHADQVIAVSKTAANDIQHHLSKWGQVPQIIAAPLGVNIAFPKVDDLPNTMSSNPYFVILGTIEPRKNHSLLLDIWDKFADKPNPPHLYIVGQRGWNNRDVFNRLDAGVANVTELNNLSDSGVSALLKDANALLFPSHAEGFGLPLAEAMTLNTPVICNDLPVFHELFGNYPVYADVVDMYSWKEAIEKRARVQKTSQKQRVKLSSKQNSYSWDDHFEKILKRT